MARDETMSGRVQTVLGTIDASELGVTLAHDHVLIDGTFMYVESGEEALGEIVRAIAARLGLGAAQSWSAEEAIAAWQRVLQLGRRIGSARHVERAERHLQTLSGDSETP